LVTAGVQHERRCAGSLRPGTAGVIGDREHPPPRLGVAVTQTGRDARARVL
jgi:hypothetical protein